MSRAASKASGVAPTATDAAASAEALLADATLALRARVAPEGALMAPALEREQHAAHGLAWLATYGEAVRQLAAYAERMEQSGRLGDTERLLVTVGLGELLAQMFGGIAMSQGEIARLADLGLGEERIAARRTPAVRALIAAGTSAETRAALAARIAANEGDAAIGDTGDDPTLAAMREQMRRFAEKEVGPHAQRWHLDNAYVPLETIAHMAELGVFGLTIPEAHGGLGLGKESMCVVSEELSRGWIGVGSLGTRAEIAAELILSGGTEAQKKKWLPGIAAGTILPTAVFTEPDTGSDLAALKTRAVRDGSVYRVYGNKTWITHAARADLMTLLVRTDTSKPGYQGLSMLMAEKPRGSDADPFPAPGMSGSEIEVPGYRGMKEFEIAFDGFAVPAENLLGGVEGEGFKQLMQTFEVGAHPDRGALDRRRASGAGRGAALRPRAPAVRQGYLRVSARGRQDRHDGGGDPGRPPAHLSRRAREGFRPPLRPRGGHGQALRRPRRVGRRRQRGADPRRQRLRARIPGVAPAGRRAHPVDLRGCRGNPGAGHRAAAAGRQQLNG